MRNRLSLDFNRQRDRGRSATVLPQQGALVARFAASDLALADGAAVTSWTDGTGGIVAAQATGGLQPTFKAAQVGGKPCVSFNGAQYMQVATPGAMKTAVDGYNFTVMIACRVTGTTALGMAFSAAIPGSEIFAFLADGARLGRFTGGSVPYTTLNQFVIQGETMTNQGLSFSPQQYYAQHYVNGGATHGLINNGTITSGGFTIGGIGAGQYMGKVDIFEILVWNTTLTCTEYLQAEMAIRDKYAQAYPWAGQSRFYVFDGDSITMGVGASAAEKTAPYLAAQSLGLPYGAWSNLGIGGVVPSQINTLAASRVDNISALIGKDVALSCFEWYNQRAAAPTPYNASLAYLTARKAASSRTKTVWGTSTDSQADNASETNRGAYNSAWDSYWAGSHPLIDSYMPIHNNASIGVNGSITGPSTTYSGDGIHLNDAGYVVLASLMQTALAALP